MTTSDPNIERVFHCAGVLLAPGSIVLRGNWGRIVKLRGPVHGSFKREMELEKYRLERASSKPSRLDAIFACPTEDGAQRFLRGQPTRITDVVYEAEIINRTAVFVGNHAEVDHASAYWRDVSLEHSSAELVIDGDLRILRQVSS
jgi:hypothetical protein